MDSNLLRRYDDAIEQMAQIRAKEAQIKKIDRWMNDLRSIYIKNKEQIRETEAKAETAKNYEVLQKRSLEIAEEITWLRAKLLFNKQSPSEVIELETQIEKLKAEQKSVAEALKIARDAEKSLVILEILKSREEEISYEGMRYKVEKENLLHDIGNMAEIPSNLEKIEAKLKSELSIPHRYKLLRMTKILFSTETQKHTFEQAMADWDFEIFDALEKKENDRLLAINLRNSFGFFLAIVQKSPMGDLIEFVIKIAKQ